VVPLKEEIHEIRCGTLDYFGPGAIEKLPFILKRFRAAGLSRVAVITGRNAYRKSGAWDRILPVLEEENIEFIHYHGIRPNPTTEQIDDAVRAVKPLSPEFVMAIGGGSVLDASKIVALLLLHPSLKARDIFINREAPGSSLPLVAVNLTHGTGSEVDRYAVATVPDVKKKVGAASDAMYPRYAIDDPELMLSLPPDEVLHTSLDAFNHLIEAATTTLSSPYTRMIAREGMKVIHKYLPRAIEAPDDLEPRYYLLYASILGGIAIDCSVVHLTHPLEHVLSAMRPGLSHGLGLCLLLPAVIRTIYPHVPEVLSEILKPVVPCLEGKPDEAEDVADSIREWMDELGIKPGLRHAGFSEDDIPEIMKTFLLAQGYRGSVSLAPLPVDDGIIERIYRESL
jgi:alcohol dehydrogenase